MLLRPCVGERLAVDWVGGGQRWTQATHTSTRYADLQGMSRITIAFGALVVAQCAHSIEEYVGRLWESFPPAAFLTGLISSDRKLGFLVINGALVTFGIWCLLWPVRKKWHSAQALMWFWVLIEMINGVGHPVWSVRQGEYTPGVITAPILLALAVYLAFRLRRAAPPVSLAA